MLPLILTATFPMPPIAPNFLRLRLIPNILIASGPNTYSE